jgi:transcriptional regulator with XRE-family HTH domain
MAIMPEPNPTVARRELAVYFRRLREQRGRSLSELGELLRVTQGQASRLDTGARGFRRGDVEQLCEWYGLGAGERGRLLAVAEEARRRAWWQQYDLDDSYRTLIGFEQAADSINEFGSLAVPGLVQTERYATAAIEASHVRSIRVDEVVGVRLRRQEVLSRPDPPMLSIVIDESVLARVAGGPAVMRQQLQHLLDLIDRPKVIIQVIGFEMGLYTAAPVQFILLDMGSRQLPPVYYHEDQFGGDDTSDDMETGQARSVWSRLQAEALDPARSASRIAWYRDQLEGASRPIR